MIDAARKAINHSIGSVRVHDDDLDNFRTGAFCDELKNAPVLTNLFNRTPLFQIAESLLGEGNVPQAGGAQIALRFPGAPDNDPAEPRGHLDGLGSGTNGMAKGVYRRGFTSFAVVYLTDVPEPYSGNFTVWPRSHRFFEDYFKKEGHQVLADGMPKVDLPEGPAQITGEAGDVVIAHHQIVHTAAPNASANIRYATIYRLRHVECEQNGLATYTDIWREWPGIREVLED